MSDQLDLERDTKAAAVKAAYRDVFAGPRGAEVLADLFDRCGLFDKNMAAEHEAFNPLAAGVEEGCRRVCLAIIDMTIGLREAERALAERISQQRGPMPSAARAAAAAITENVA